MKCSCLTIWTNRKGGLVIAAGWGYRAPALVGVGLALAGLAVLLLSASVHRRTARAAG